MTLNELIEIAFIIVAIPFVIIALLIKYLADRCITAFKNIGMIK